MSTKIIDRIANGDIDVILIDDNRLSVPDNLQKVDIDNIVENKKHIIDILLCAQRQAQEIIALAMLRCDEFGDDENAREQMRRDIINTPPRLLPELGEYFRDVVAKGVRQ